MKLSELVIEWLHKIQTGSKIIIVFDKFDKIRVVFVNWMLIFLFRSALDCRFRVDQYFERTGSFPLTIAHHL
jgi:hypothetical protein